MSMRVEGIGRVVSNLNRIANNMRGNIDRAVSDIALDLLSKSQQRAPIDTGDLRGSGFADIHGSSATVGFVEPYALRQHENLDFNHPGGGEAKYLENPLKENERNYINRIKEEIRRETR